MKKMARRKDPILEIELRKQLLKLEMQKQELEIRESARELKEYFTLPTITNTVLGYAIRNPEPALRLGITVVDWITGMVGGRKRAKNRRRKSAEK
jgi:hypothetical protein